jgi:hypothetical protein
MMMVVKAMMMMLLQVMARDLGYTQLETVVEEEDSLLRSQQFRTQFKMQ